jgi:hypothetical protein
MRLVACLLALTLPRAARADDFWRYWADGKAELDGYALTQPRYGEPRAGTAVLIFVTEDFSDSARVKADPGKHPPADVHPVLKLNFVRDFQTGIYDYNILSSTFLRTEWSGEPWPLDKTSFSSQEWCGHVYQQWITRGAELQGVSHSYFDGEADQTRALPLVPGGVVEEAIPVLVRGLRGDWLAPGASKTVPFLPSALRARLGHRPQAWGEATVSRAPAATATRSALGELRAIEWTVEERGGVRTTWTVEEAAPHRILGWSASDGESGRLLGSARLPYWELHGNGGEASLKLLGLSVPAPQPRRR